MDLYVDYPLGAFDGNFAKKAIVREKNRYCPARYAATIIRRHIVISPAIGIRDVKVQASSAKKCTDDLLHS